MQCKYRATLRAIKVARYSIISLIPYLGVVCDNIYFRFLPLRLFTDYAIYYDWNKKMATNANFYFRLLHQSSILLIQRVSFDYRKADGSVISVCVVEIDQRKLPNGSSLFILADGNGKGRAVPGSAVTELLKAYVDAKTLDQMGASMAGKGLTFMHKKHPMEKGEDYLNRWCNALKERLEGV